jgi:anti-anti-sigma factor
MSTTLERQDIKKGVYMFAVHGDLDAAGGLAVKDEFETYVAENPARCIVDLSDVSYMSSYGLRVLLSVAKILQEGGGELHLAAPTQRVMDVLATSGYDTLFPVHATLDKAKSTLGA